MDHIENAIPRLLYPIDAMETRLFAKPLLSNGSYIFAHPTVAAQQWVYLPHWSLLKAICLELPTGVSPFILFQGLCL
jgi:hypothetical protein